MPYIDTTLKLDDIPPGESRCLQVDDFQIGLFRSAEGLFALDNECPHRGAPLNQGMIRDGQVTCPWHQWQFQLADGTCRNIPGAKVASYATEIRDGQIWINLEQKGAS